jgi:hypothetical protein
MAILETADGVVEVQIFKRPFDANPPVCFQEYSKKDQSASQNREVTHDIVAESGAYGIHITVKKGFVLSTDIGFWISVIDDATKVKIYQCVHYRDASADHVLNQDQTIVLTHSRTNGDNKIIIAGESKVGSDFAFQALLSGNPLEFFQMIWRYLLIV